MAFDSRFYTIGLATIELSPTDVVTGNGTAWTTAIVAGDTFSADGIQVPIKEVIDDETIQLAYIWPGSPLTDASYVINKDSPDRTTQSTIAASLIATAERWRTLFNGNTPNYAIVEYGVTAPPSASVGDKYVVGAGATGAFSDHEDEIAEKTENGWAFLEPSFGWLIVSETDGSGSNVARVWDGSQWNEAAGLAAAPNYVGIWSGATAYQQGDVVNYANTLYIASQGGTNQNPATQTAYWDVFSIVGRHGGAFTLEYLYRTSTTDTVANVSGQTNLDAAPSSAPNVLRLSVTDTLAVDRDDLLASLATASTSDVLGTGRLVSVDDPANGLIFDIDAVVAAGGSPVLRYDLSISNVRPYGTLADNTAVLFLFTAKGDKGTIGATGATGARGVQGGPFAIPFTIDTANYSDANPGSGKARLSTATQTSALVLRVNDANSGGTNVASVLAKIANGDASPIAVGRLSLASDPENIFLEFDITDFAAETGYSNVTIANLVGSSANPFALNDAVVFNWMPCFKGDTGSTGATGAQGEPFEPDHVVALIANRSTYDNAAAGTSVLVERDEGNDDKPTIYFLITPDLTSPVWSEGSDFVTTADGDQIVYDGTSSGSDSTTVQAAIDELFGLSAGLEAASPDVASASTVDLTAITAKFIQITGTTTITAITMRAHQIVWVRWAAAGAITHNGTTLPLDGAVSRTNSADRWSLFRADASENVREIYYTGGRIRFDIAQTTLTSAQTQQARTNIGVAPNKNFIDNSALNFWQRATSFGLASTTKTVVADRWKAFRGATGSTISRQTGFSGSKYCLRQARDNANASATVLRLWHQLHESVARGLAGQTVILSFDVRAGANYSGGVMTVRIHTGTAGSEAADLSQSGTGAFVTGGAQTPVSTSVTPTTVIQRVVCSSLAMGSTIADLAIQIQWTPAGTAGAADYLEFTNFKLEIGSVATPFDPPLEQSDLAACNYTYQKSFAEGTAPATNVGTGTGEHVSTATRSALNTNYLPTVRLKASMRIVPTVTFYNPAAANNQMRDLDVPGDCTSSAATNVTTHSFLATATGNASTGSNTSRLAFHWTADAELL